MTGAAVLGTEQIIRAGSVGDEPGMIFHPGNNIAFHPERRNEEAVNDISGNQINLDRRTDRHVELRTGPAIGVPEAP